MKTLDAHGDDYRNAQLTILLEVRSRWLYVGQKMAQIFFMVFHAMVLVQWTQLVVSGTIQICFVINKCSEGQDMSLQFRFFYPSSFVLLQDETGAHLDPAAGAEDNRLNGVSGSTSSAALHHAAGPKKRRHRIPRQEKDKDQQVGEQFYWTACCLFCGYQSLVLIRLTSFLRCYLCVILD